MSFLKMQRKFTESSDGCRIAYWTHGDGPHTMVLVPGLGTPPEAYHFLVQHFSPRFRCITWNLRGTFDSEKPPEGHLDIPFHVADLEAITLAEDLGHFVLGGWSLGVQIALEYALHHQAHIQAMLLINGTFGHPMRFHDPLRKTLLSVTPPVLRAIDRPLQRLIQGSFRLPWLWQQSLRLTGFVAANHDTFIDLATIYTTQSFRTLLDIVEAADEHTIEPFLHQIDVPALVTAGTHDWMTPPERAKRLVELLPQATYLEIQGGTHYTPLEFPEPINVAAEKLFQQVGLS
ncbi:MAG: alpha/beta hydrolase [Myxococcales bacterium]|nr:alpha/beta hydrolase [Myxococcales bacterium]MCB9641503.1 alpha/beta hydrolase [Myxococcales bacterium]